MGDVTHILPVLHCLKRGIAFVSSSVVISSLPKRRNTTQSFVFKAMF